MTTGQVVANRERVVRVQNGWVMLAIVLGGLVLTVASIAATQPHGGGLIARIVVIVGLVVLVPGFFSLQPNEARVLVLFGDKDVVHLDDERRAAMVSNLMVVLWAESEVHPVVNTGTLYD
jgi:hypothetical protein